MPKHLHIIQTLDIARSGGLVSVVALHRAMLENGIESRLAYVRTKKQISPPVESFALDALWQNRFYFGWGNADRLAEAIERAEVIHVHGLYTYLNYVCGREAARFGKALVYHPHGSLAPVYLQRGKIKKAVVLRAFERRNFAQLAAWRALTETEADQIKAYVGEACTLVIPNGVSLPADTSRTPELEKRRRGKRIFLFLSRVAHTKGLDLFLEAWLAAVGQRLDCEWWIAGPAFDDMGTYLASRIAQHQLKNVVCLGAVSDAEKDLLLRAADVFVLPSRGEGQSAAILEAMAYGKPVLLTKKCYFPIAASEGAGLECETDSGGMAEALLQFLGMTQEKLQGMGARARTVIAARFDIRDRARELDEKTKELLNPRP